MRDQVERKSHFLVGFGEAGDQHAEGKGLVSFDKGDITVIVALGSPEDFREKLIEVLERWAGLEHHIGTNWIVCHPRIHRDVVVSIIEERFGWSSPIKYANSNLTSDVDLSVLVRDLDNRLNRSFEIENLSVEVFNHEHLSEEVISGPEPIWKRIIQILRAIRRTLRIRYAVAFILSAAIAAALLIIESEEDLTVAIDHWPGNLPGLAANGGDYTKRGSLYDSLGLEVRFRYEENHRKRWLMLVNDQTDIISLTLDQIIEFGNESKSAIPDIRVLLSTAWSYGGHGLVASEKMESIRDLTRTVAAQRISPSYYFFRLLRKRGRPSMMALDLDEMLPEESVEALKSGDVGAIVLGDPYLTLARETEGIRVLATAYRLPDIDIQSVLVARKSILDSKREFVGRFVWGWLAMTAEAHKNGKEFVTDIHTVWPELLTESRLQGILKNNVYMIDGGENIELHVLNGMYGTMGFDGLLLRVANSLGLDVPMNVESAFSDILGVLKDSKSLGTEDLLVDRWRQEATVNARQEAYDMMTEFQGGGSCYFISHPPGQSAVQDDARSELRDLRKRLAAFLREYNEFKIEVVGRSDKMGEPEPKESMSLKRAREIEKELRIEIESSRIVVDWRGDLEATGTPEIDRQTKICLVKP